MRDTVVIAYCGPAAVPVDLLTRWNIDPLLVVGLATLAIVIARGRVANARAGWAALALIAVIFISPLCALSSALFSARVLHHVLLIAAVAPLLVLAFTMRRRHRRFRCSSAFTLSSSGYGICPGPMSGGSLACQPIG